MRQNINELRPSIPSVSAFSKQAFQQSDEIFQKFKDIISNPQTSHRLYKTLKKLLSTNDPTYKTPYTIEIYPGVKIPFFIHLIYDRGGKESPHGRYAVRQDNGWFASKYTAIALGLWGDPDKELILWDNNYRSVITHEITHALQALTTVLRVLHQKNIKPTPKLIKDLLMKVGLKGGSGKKLKDLEKSFGEEALKKLLAYHTHPSELGANANTLLNFLASKLGIEAIEAIVSYVDKGYPTFKDIDNAIREADRVRGTVWGIYDELIDTEMELRQIRREEWTEGYKLKKTLLKVASEFYKRHYK